MAAALVVAFAAIAVVALALRYRRRASRPYPALLAPLLELRFWRPLTPAAAARRHGLEPGMTALELGPAGGFFTAAALEAVAPAGRLLCVDVQVRMLLRLRARLGSRTPALVCADATRLPFRAGVLDLIFAVHVLGETAEPRNALLESARVLRSGGILAVTEGLPDPDFIRLPRLDAMAAAAGLRPTELFGRELYYTRRFTRSAGVGSAPAQ